jgi:antigen flippase
MKWRFRRIAYLLRHPQELAKHFIDADFVGKVLSTLATKGLLFVFSIAATVLVTRALGPSGRGIYALAITLSALGVQFGNFGFHSSNTFYVAKNPDLLGKLVANTLCVSLGGGSIIAALLGAAFIVWPHLAPIQGWSLALGLVGIPIGLAYLLLQNLLLGCYRVGAYNYIEIGSRLINIALILVFLMSGYISAVTAVAATVLAGAVAASLCLFLLLRGARLISPSWQLLRTTFSYAFRAYLLAFFSFTVLKADILITKFLLGTDQTGQYSVAVNLADILCMAPITVASILFPRLSAMTDPEEKWQKTRNICYLVGGVMLGLALMVALASPLIVRMLFGPAFLPAASALAWLMPGVVFISMTGILSMYVGSISIPKKSIGVFCAMSMLNIVLNFILLPRIGIRGASIASSICYLGCLIGILAIAFDLKRKGSRHFVNSEAIAGVAGI